MIQLQAQSSVIVGDSFKTKGRARGFLLVESYSSLTSESVPPSWRENPLFMTLEQPDDPLSLCRALMKLHPVRSKTPMGDSRWFVLL